MQYYNASQIYAHVITNALFWIFKRHKGANKWWSKDALHTSIPREHRVSLVLFVLVMTPRLVEQCTIGSGDCDASASKVIPNPLDIGFVHGNIHDRSCTKLLPFRLSSTVCPWTNKANLTTEVNKSFESSRRLIIWPIQSKIQQNLLHDLRYIFYIPWVYGWGVAVKLSVLIWPPLQYSTYSPVSCNIHLIGF